MRILLGAILGLASLAVTVALIWISVWYRWRKWRMKRPWEHLKRTGDPSQLDPDARALLEQTMQARPDLAQALERRRAAQERGELGPHEQPEA